MTPDFEARLREMAESVIAPAFDFGENPSIAIRAWHLVALFREVAALAAQEQREQDARIAERLIYSGGGVAAAIRADAPERSE